MKFLHMFWCLIFAFVHNSATQLNTDDRIIGGRPALEGECPYQVAILRSYNDNFFCSGSIIAPNIVLTAAHCMFYKWGGKLPPIIVSVLAGQNSLLITSKSVYRNASKIVIHEDYDHNSYANDVALIKVSENFPIKSNKLISEIELQNKELDAGSCLVSGWGVHEVNSTTISENLFAVNVDIVNRKKCFEMYNEFNISLSDGMMCAGVSDGTKDACQGDSGGPFVCKGFLTGIVSTGSGCANPDFPGIYAEVAHFLPWIKNMTQDLNKEEHLQEDQKVTTSNHHNIITMLEKLLHLNSGGNLHSKHVMLLLLLITFIYSYL